jgi:glycosyltransferase involved in cell wall biosynthesis
MSRVLFVSNDYVDRRMAGPAIRAFELSRQLTAHGHQVTLAIPAATDVEAPFELAVYDHTGETLLRLAPEHDVLVFQGWVLERFPSLRDSGPALAVDLYDPFPLELLVTISREPTERRRQELFEAQLCLNEQIRAGDFFMCASEKQRDYWLGALSTLNRINPESYAADPSLRSLLDVVPFGIPSDPPRKRPGQGARGRIPGIGADDLLLLWGGGVYNWFDPLTLVRAVALAAPDLPQLRLLFMATQHPNPDVPEMWMLTRTRELAEELGLTGRHVFFNESWVPYDERGAWFAEADAGVSTHFDHVETRFSFRTRVLDYLWAGLPIISTEGDTLAGDIEREALGRVVPPEDSEALASAIRSLSDEAERRRIARRVRAYAKGHTWERVAEPLVRFCDAPRRAADLAAGSRPLPVRVVVEAPASHPRPGAVRRMAGIARREGPAGVARAGLRWLRRRLRKGPP